MCYQYITSTIIIIIIFTSTIIIITIITSANIIITSTIIILFVAPLPSHLRQPGVVLSVPPHLVWQNIRGFKGNDAEQLKMPKIDTLDALEEHEEHEDDYQTNSNW